MIHCCSSACGNPRSSLEIQHIIRGERIVFMSAKAWMLSYPVPKWFKMILGNLPPGYGTSAWCFITFNVGTYTQDQEGANLQFIEHQLLEFMGGPWVSYESFRTWDVIRYTYYEHIHSWRNQDELRGRITFDIYRRKQAISHTFSYVTINANISQIWHAIVKVARYSCCCRENYDKLALFRGAGNN